MNDLCIRGGHVVTPEGIVKADIGVCEEIVREIGPSINAAKTVCAEGAIILPGMIDSHVHIRGGVFSYREDFRSGSAAAAEGGVTTILEMPVAKPPASTVQVFNERRLEAESEAFVDIALYGGAGGDNINEIQNLAQAGAVAFKTFMMPPPQGREAEFYGLCSESGDTLRHVMKAVRKTSLPLAVHAEDNDVVASLTKKVASSGSSGLDAWEATRPLQAELSAVKRVIAAAAETGCRTIVCHVSTREGLELIREAKHSGLDIYAESCPHYLALDYELAGEAGVFARVKPPLRSPVERQALLDFIVASRGEAVDFIGSDHAPYLSAEKTKGDIWGTVDGMPSLEFSLPLLLNFVREGGLGYAELAEMTAGRAAKAFALECKGAIEVGKDADFVIVRIVPPWSPVVSEMHSKSRESAALFERIRFTHCIDKTFVRGKMVYSRDGANEQNSARFIRPNLRH